MSDARRGSGKSQPVYRRAQMFTTRDRWHLRMTALNSPTMDTRQRTSGRWLTASTIATAVMVIGVACLGGCKQDVRLADHRVRHPEVRTVSHYGLTLDESATPKEVSYVLLRAIHDDFTAETKDARETALDIQFDLCAAGAIAQRNPTSLPRDDFLYTVIYRWTPSVAHYVDSFPKDWEEAKARFVRSLNKSSGGGETTATEARVYIELQDPSGDANAQVVLIVGLAKDSGYWRVRELNYDYKRRSIAGRGSVAGIERP